MKMTNVLKSKETDITEELLASMIGKMIHVPTNEHVVVKQLTDTKEIVNVWFAGVVAGYDKQIVGFNYATDEFCEPYTVYSLLLTDGHAYVLSPTACEVNEITMEDFTIMIEEQQKIQDAKDSIILPGTL